MADAPSERRDEGARAARAPRLPPHLDWLIRPAPGPDPAPAPAEADVTGAYAWPAGSRLAGELAALVDCRGAVVADLGCGLGQLGFSALALGAQQVLFADGSPVAIDLAARTIGANRFGARARACRHLWGQALPGAPCTLILGGDILYRPECFAGLVDTIHASLAPGGQCLLADPRTRLDDEFAALLAGRRLGWRLERRAAGYTLARVAWLDG
jgi:SAM-dependent methyltransferase